MQCHFHVIIDCAVMKYRNWISMYTYLNQLGIEARQHFTNNVAESFSEMVRFYELF